MPVAPASTPELLQLIQKSGVAAAALPDADVLPTEPQKAAGVLVQKGVITRFQAAQLLLGRHKGFRLGPHVILEQIGRGGMGVVYLAEHLELRRKVAIKVLVVGKGEDAKLAAERFFREARAAAALDHPNIVRIFDVCRANDTPYLVMEYVEGETLQQALDRDGALPYPAAADAAAQAAAGLQHAHEKGFVHRDIKPGNLMRDKTGAVKILDMGLARLTASAADKLTERLDAGAVVGTADFIAPEQALNSPQVDIRADIYSLGATFFALVTGNPPFAGNTTQKLLQHQMATAPNLGALDPTLPKGLAGVAAKMLAKKPGDRFQTPADVIAALAPWLGDSSRVMAGLSRTSLAAGADLHAKLHPKAGLSTGRMKARRSEDAVPDSGVIDPADPAAETGGVAAARTARSPRPRPAAPRRAPVFPAVAGGVAVVAAAAGIAFALGAFDRPPARDTAAAPPVAAPAPEPKADPTPPPKPDPNPAPAGEPRVAYRLDLAGLPAFMSRGRSEGNGLKGRDLRYLESGRTGPGDFPRGWEGHAWDREGEAEFTVGPRAGRPAFGGRNVQRVSAFLVSPDVTFNTPAARVRFQYLTGSAGPKSAAFRFKIPGGDNKTGLVEVAALDGTAGTWRAFDQVIPLRGYRTVFFEFHTSEQGDNGGFFLADFEAADAAAAAATPAAPGAGPPAPSFAGKTEGPRVYRLLAADVPAFRVTKEQYARTAGDEEKLPPGVLARCWKAGTTGEFRRAEADGSPAFGVTNLSDDGSGQFAFELEREMGLTLRPGAAYRVRLEYLLRNEANGGLVVQTTDFKNVATARLDGPPGGWKTAAVAFERAEGVPVRLTIDNNAVGEGNTLFFRAVEVVELR